MNEIREHRGQKYWFRGLVGHERADGSMTLLAQWETACAECGAPFLVKTTQKWEPAKRCANHRRPGRAA